MLVVVLELLGRFHKYGAGSRDKSVTSAYDTLKTMIRYDFVTGCDLHRESSQVTHTCPQLKLQAVEEATNFKSIVDKSRPEFDYVDDLDNEFGSDDGYVEYMQNLSPCSSMATKTSQVMNEIPFNATHLSNIRSQREITSSTETSPQATEIALATTSINDIKMEIYLVNTNDKLAFTTHDLCEYVATELCAEMQLAQIEKPELIASLTMNHLLVYILYRLRSRGMLIPFISQLKLIHLGKPYTADRGVYDAKFLTLQAFVHTMQFQRSVHFHLSVRDVSDLSFASQHTASTQEMLLRSSVWRESVMRQRISATYADTLMKKMKWIKINTKRPRTAEPTDLDNSAPNSAYTQDANCDTIERRTIRRIRRVCSKINFRMPRVHVSDAEGQFGVF